MHLAAGTATPDTISTAMGWFIAAHAVGASVALVLGAVNLRRQAKGDPVHRRVGRVWVVCMYWTILSSFAITRLNPGHFSWIHLLSIFTFGTLTIGLWAAMTGRIQTHQRYMTGSYFGLLGAFVGAVVVPVRAIPQFAEHHPAVLAGAAAGMAAAAVSIVHLAHISDHGLTELVADERQSRPRETPLGNRALIGRTAHAARHDRILDRMAGGGAETRLRELDLGRLLGASVDQARAVVASVGGVLRAIGSDAHQGLPTAFTADIRRDRVNVVVTDGRVVKVWGPG